jgi:CTP:molybdopterin cytidylyltransferase MocA
MIGAIVLAAGASSRMGHPKAELTIGAGGPTFLDAILASLDAAGVAAVRVVVSEESGRRRNGGVVNPNPAAGMLSSVHCGLRALPSGLDAVVLWPVDHPLVKPATVLAMIAAFRAGGAPIVVPTHDGRRGHPVLFAARVVPELFGADASRGAAAVVRAHDDRLELAVTDRGVLHDIDTPEDYARLAGATDRASREAP